MSASENRHTARWWVSEATDAYGSKLVMDEEGLVAAVTTDDDARLIAAAPDLRRELRGARCPRPCNNRPDDFEVGQCVDAGECGCSLGAAISKAEGGAA